MAKFTQEFIAAAEIAGGIGLMYLGGAWTYPIGKYLIAAGIGTAIAGVGTLLSKGALQGQATSTRNPVSPWKAVYGRVRMGGALVYMNMWGDSFKMLDLVIVLAAHPCQAVDALLFDQQRIFIDTSASPGGAAAGSGTSFTPVQQTVNISEIKRVKGVVTVTLPSNIPYLIESDHIEIAEDGPGLLTANALIGTFSVAQILNRIGGIKFTYLSGGSDCDISGHGHVHTTWADYGRKVYFEPLFGGQTLGQTFKGMAGTPYDGDMGSIVNPDKQKGLGGDTANIPNLWTANCSLQGKTAVFLRLHYNDKYFKGGLPQISFIMRGKNDILDPRTSPPTYGYTENAALCIADFLSNPVFGFKAAYGTEIPYASLVAAANVCDEAVPLATSPGSPPLTEPAYACNGQFDLTLKRGEILQNMLTSCAGRLTYTEGQFQIWPAAWTGNAFAIGSNPGGGIVALGEFSKIAAGPIRWKPTVSIRDRFNGVKGTYISQANKWMSSDLPAYAQDSLHGYATSPPVPEDDANLAADGGDRRWLDIQLPFTISPAAAQRIAKIELLRRRHSGTGTLILNMAGYQIAPLDLILVTIPYLGWVEKQFEVIETRLRAEETGNGAPALLVEIDIQETASSIYDWSTSEELSPQGYQQPAIPGIGSFDFFPRERVPGFSVPFPWEPGYAGPLVGDAVYPGPVVGGLNEGPASFGIRVEYGADAQGDATASLSLKGTAPPNRLSAIHSPQISALPGTSGNLPAGTYIVAAAALDTGDPVRNSALSVPVIVTIPESSPPANNGSIDVAVSWPAGSNGGEIYLASAAKFGVMAGAAENGYFFQAALDSSTTSFRITDFDQATPGAPDSTFDHLALVWKKVIHGGCWAEQIQAVTANTITIAQHASDDPMTPDQWAGRVLTLIGKLDSTQEVIILNMPVLSSTATFGGSPGPPEFTLTIGPNSAGDQLPDLTTLLVVGDLVVMRFQPAFTDTSFSDPEIANPYYPGGDTAIESGHLAVVLTGPDAGDVQTIASVSTDGFGDKTIINLAAPWKLRPNDGDIVVVVEAAWSPEVHTQALSSPARDVITGELAKLLLQNLAGQHWLFLARTQDAENVNGDDAFAPVREVYFYGAQGTRTIQASDTMLPTDRTIDVDASGGDVVYTLLPFSQIPNQGINVQKIDASAHTVTVLCAGSPPVDFINGQPSIVLSNQWDFIVIFVRGN